jgi:sulfur carrier protein
MKVTVNNREVETTASNLLLLSQQLNLPLAGIAVAVNNRIVPRAEWENFTIAQGDSLIIIKAVCGG